MALVSIIIPVFNEEENIIPLYAEISQVIDLPHEIIWVDDGSTDNSFNRITEISGGNNHVKCVSFSRNFGQQAAFLAGLHHANGDYVVLMDGDLQHPPSLIPELLQKLHEGFDMCSGKRIETDKISFTKKYFSKFYYKIINLLSDIHIEENIADFRAFNKKVKNAVLQFEEKELFLRGIFSWVGFSKTTVTYHSPERKHGKTKYTRTKMVRLGIKGLTSFTFKPLRLSFIIGGVMSAISFLLAIGAVIAYLNGQTIQGWTSLMIAIMLFGGIQLLFLGLIGEYLASLLTETKKRPAYIINNTLHIDNEL